MKHYLSGLITVLLLLVTTNSISQVVQKTQIQFAKGKFELTAISKKKIDSVAALLMNIPVAYSIDIVEIIDSTVAPKLTKTVTLNRSTQLLGYFVKKGFAKSKIRITAKKYSDFIQNPALLAENIQSNSVIISFRIASPPASALTRIQEAPTTYLIDADSGKVIKHTSGTIVMIPPVAFEDLAGNTVYGSVEIRYQEFKSKADYLLSQLPISHVSELQDAQFNMSGAFRLEAFQNGLPLQLKKNQVIQSSFELGDSPKTLNFYSYDPQSNRWKEVKKLIGQTSTRKMKSFQSQDPLLTTKSENSKPVFTVPEDTCVAKKLFIDEAKQLCTSNTSYYDILIDSIRVKPLERQLDSLRKKVFTEKKKSMNIQSFYVLKKIQKEQTLFMIEVEPHPLNLLTPAYLKYLAKENKNNEEVLTTNENDELKAYKDIQWVVDTRANPKFKPTSFKRVWTNCEILQDGAFYTINLTDSAGTFSITKVDMVFKEKLKKKEKAAKIVSMQANYDDLHPTNARIRRDLEGELDRLNDQMKQLNRKKDSVMKMDISAVTDTLRFIWKGSKPYMNEAEQELTFENWVKYVESNKGLLLQRYQFLANDPSFSSCLQLIDRRLAIAKEYESSSKEALKGSTKVNVSLNLKNLGVFACSSITLLSNSEELRASYVDKLGKKVDPVVAYLVDDHINGVIKYDGLANYSPYKFTFSPESKNTLFVVDALGNVFIAKNDQFKMIKPVSTTDTQIKHVFTVEKFLPADKTGVSDMMIVAP